MDCKIKLHIPCKSNYVLLYVVISTSFHTYALSGGFLLLSSPRNGVGDGAADGNKVPSPPRLAADKVWSLKYFSDKTFFVEASKVMRNF